MGDQISVTVLGINYAPEPFGIAPYTTGLCRGLASRGYRVNVVTGMPHYPQWRVSPEYRWKWTAIETLDGVSLKRVRHSVPARASNGRRVLMEATFGARAAVSRWKRPDVVICTTPALIATAAQCLRRRGSVGHRPVFGVWVQDLYSVGLSETQNPGSATARLAGRLEGWVMREADGIIVAHDQFRTRLVQNLQVDPTTITTIRNWTHVQSSGAGDRTASRARLGWADNETVVLHAGNMGVKQGLENVVRAAQIADKDRLKLRFVLMGDGNQRCMLEAMARQTTRLEIRDPLPQSDFADALEAADVLLVNERPGVAEMSIPSKLTSYFQSGTPVLAATSPESNAAQEIRNSRAGIVVDAGDAARLVAAAASLGRDPNLRTELGTNGIAYAAVELSEAASIDKFDNWIKRMLATQKIWGSGDTDTCERFIHAAGRWGQ
ncbi:MULTISPECIES: glycosyltransferase [unclassified Mycolicibacterium]|uniref:glycosyltransferase n=1 Tax=unclassified Mycolicibacterium TaxID=2636767 RepID=UPI0012DF5D7C|nr:MULTISPECIES: glycosyltransferase [unclassified Mycolicibacterium]MUL83995.1 glycosyltransferase [Mycolicibacterium sp. CBMA 329]MUL89939.1 glycosyltransferase [Mycolicibacterium sp. CBMA 331]MUL98040.1 glycosyltransferase [Mycolicibacterium sp. CBMA 334]MUM30271.1 glycosyltransferase [Mycolicibacterium sp. CBMA 295]MUM39454.1 glycosyltransferase [Mycolicibacterium sp. CBMA 247]